MSSNIKKAMELIDKLTPDEKMLIYNKLNDEINDKQLEFVDTLNERVKSSCFD